MGTDNLFHKNRLRREQNMKRIQAIRAEHDVVLIVCEGQKTEPNYFKKLRVHLRLNSATVIIFDKSHGADPLRLANYAEAEFMKDRSRDPEKQGHDRVFVVFDKDTHTTYDSALLKIRALNKKHKDRFQAITSVPCFEFWLLLHFRDTASPYAASGKCSVCDNVIRDLKEHLPSYGKGDADIFEKTYPLMATAIKHAEQLEKRQEKAGTDNPSTKVHRLVTYLHNIEYISH